MATISQFLISIFNSTIIFFSTLFLEFAVFAYETAKTSVRRKSTTVDQLLEIVGQCLPEHKVELGFEVYDEECRVCLSCFQEGDKVRDLKCGHTFHKECIDTWLQRESATCPLCRGAVLPPEMVAGRLNHCRNLEYDDDGDEEVMVLYALHGNFFRFFF
ncbi:RING-H2 finger protein ATL5 [Striga hermonthica]|uniref:RING-H2 finger protein ATL5 n=1 Tax=Striga hermonthica TaxID=68872 RepID=A0A9N7NVS8_STRHE|nr:RING-H2 finger protein ATL5 [Striga hermonthica]